MQKKIRAAQKEKVYYMLIMGDREIENSEVNVRERSGETHNAKIEDFVKEASDKINKRELN